MVGERIRVYREALGLGLGALAAGAGVRKGYLSELENGRSDRPSAVTAYRLAEALGVSIYDLIDAPQSARTNPALPARPTGSPEDPRILGGAPTPRAAADLPIDPPDADAEWTVESRSDSELRSGPFGGAGDGGAG